MLKEKLIEYYDSINPSQELIERMVNMSNIEKRKKITLSKRAIALLVAAVILIVGVTGYAAISRIVNDNKGIVSVNQDESFSFDFSKASRNPEKLSDENSKLIKNLKELGYEKILLPLAILDDSAEITNTIHPFLTENGCLMDLNVNTNSINLQMIKNLTPEDMNGYYGTGDENTVCYVVQANGIDICVNIEGNDELGYYAYYFYAVDDTIYCINLFVGANYDDAYQKAIDFIKF